MSKHQWAQRLLCALRTGLRGSKLAAVALLASILCATPHARAATPYEYQIGGFVSAVLQTLIAGEFAGRRTSQADAALHRPVCRPADYDHLRAAANDTRAFDAFHQRCRLVEAKLEGPRIHITAYLPAGYCETLKTVFETVLQEQVYAGPARVLGDYVIIEYKGARYAGTSRTLARTAQINGACREDGSLRITAARKHQ